MAFDVYYRVLLWMCAVGFLASVPLVLAMRARRPQRMPWWLVVVLAAALGWLASNLYSYVEAAHFEAWRQEYLRRGAYVFLHGEIAHPSITIPLGWIPGLVYLAACIGLYPVFRANVNGRASRTFVGMSAAGIVLATCVALSSWWIFLLLGPFAFAVLYADFVACASLSHLVLRAFRSQAAWIPAAVMFPVALVVSLPFRYWFVTVFEERALTQPTLLLQIRAATEWALLFGGLFTAFWWIAIRPTRNS